MSSSPAPVAPDPAVVPVPAPRAGEAAARARDLGARQGRRLLTAWRPATWAVLGYLAARVVNLLVVAAMAAGTGKPFWGSLASWDGVWFRDIADFGYVDRVPVSPAGKPYWVNVEFFPGFPWAVRAVSALTGLSSLWAGLLVTFAAGAVAAWGVFALAREVTGSRRVATLAAVLWGVAPGSMVLTMVYSEALFVAFASWGLLAVVRRRWGAAAVLCVLAGLTRNTAFALVAAVGVAALAVVLERRDDGRRVGLLAPEARRPLLATVVSPLGCVGFIAWVGWVAGRPDAWFWIQDRAFNLRFDFGVSTVQWMIRYLTQLGRPVYVICTFVVILSVAVFVWSLFDRTVPPPVHVYGAVVMFLALTTSNGWFFQSKPRFMLPAFTIVLPLAKFMARWPRAVTASVVLAGAAFSAWYVAYLVFVVNTNP